MKISKLLVTGKFKYFWLKSVEAVDLSKHCARCLIGEYDERINSTQTEYLNLHLDRDIYYLCGVTQPFIWKNNFHLAFKAKEGSKISVNKNGVLIEIEDAEQLPISPKYILDTSKGTAYLTCRNWQFANYFKSHIEMEVL